MENKIVKVTLITGVCGTTGSAILDYLSLNDTEVVKDVICFEVQSKSCL